jgi:hypothetical protein
MATPRVFHHLDRVLDALFDGRHRWDERDPAAVEQSAWASEEGRAGRRVLDAVEKLLGAQLYEPRAEQESKMHTMTLTVALTAAPPLALLPSEAVKALETPAFVIVENGESDRAFLEAMLRAFGRAALKEALDRRLWEVVSAGGGGEIPKRLGECIAKIGEGPRRVLILSDSDRLTPGEQTKIVKDITTCAQEHGVEAILLGKREIENYLPYEALWEKSRHRPRCNAFLQLAQPQRDHYDMKKGFVVNRQTGEVRIPAAQQKLFASVRPRRVLEELQGGFGDKVWASFQSTKVTERAMRDLCPDDEEEIPRLLDVIEAMI